MAQSPCTRGIGAESNLQRPCRESERNVWLSTAKRPRRMVLFSVITIW